MPTNQDGLIVSPKYVYLDWNSFACARDSEHPLHEVFVQAINTAKEQGVHFPFSEAHIRDLFTKSRFTENEHTEKNFEAISNISDNWYLGTASEDVNIYLLAKKSPREIFDFIKSTDPKDAEYATDFVLSKEPYADLREQYVKQYDFVISGLAMNGNIEAAACVKKLSSQTKEELVSVFRDAVVFICNLSHKGEFSEAYFIQNGFRFLDFTQIFKEKLTKKNLPANIMNDGTHAFFSKEAVYFVSEDADFREKYQFMKQISALKAQILSIQEFCDLTNWAESK